MFLHETSNERRSDKECPQQIFHSNTKFLEVSADEEHLSICANEQDDDRVLHNGVQSNRFGTQRFLVENTVKVVKLLILMLLGYVI